MQIDRYNLKRQARTAMSNARPNALLMTLLYLLLTTGVSLLLHLLAEHPLDQVLSLYRQGLPLDRAIPLALTGVGTLGIFLNLLLVIYCVVVDFGYVRWCLMTARGEQGDAEDLFAGFSMVGRILWLRILTLLYSLLWYLLLFMPLAVFGIAALFIPVIGPVLFGLLALGALVIVISRILRYAMGVYCLVDDPELGAAHALYRSSQMMKGRVKDYIVLMLSFFGWWLLAALITMVAESVTLSVIGGIGLIAGADPSALNVLLGSAAVGVVLTLASWPLELWLKPYIAITESNFYNAIKGGEDPASV